MVNEAEAHAEEDKERRETVDAKNNADALIHSTEKNLKEYGDKVSGDEKSAIEDSVQELKDALESDDVEAITAKTEALTESAMKLGEAIYKASQEEGGDGEAAEGGEEAGGKDSDDDGTVVDADFEEVDPNEASDGPSDGPGDETKDDADFEEAAEEKDAKGKKDKK